MTDSEFKRVKSLLQASYPRLAFFDNPDGTDLFFNILNRYAFTDVFKGVRDYIELEKFPPTISDIVSYIERTEKNRKDQERQNARDAWRTSVKCTRCNDTGYIMVTHRDGTEAVRICSCDTAREKSPWAFMSDQELQTAVENQRKKGKNPPTGRPGMPRDWYVERCGEVMREAPLMSDKYAPTTHRELNLSQRRQ